MCESATRTEMKNPRYLKSSNDNRYRAVPFAMVIYKNLHASSIIIYDEISGKSIVSTLLDAWRLAHLPFQRIYLWMIEPLYTCIFGSCKFFILNGIAFFIIFTKYNSIYMYIWSIFHVRPKRQPTRLPTNTHYYFISSLILMIHNVDDDDTINFNSIHFI